MSGYRLNRALRDLAVEQSLDAAIELEEVIKHQRDAAPALEKLVSTLIGSRPGEHRDKMDLLGDSQATSLYYRAALSSRGADQASIDLDEVLRLFLDISSIGLRNFPARKLSFIRDFCLNLNRELVSESFNRAPEPPLSRIKEDRVTLDGY